uniref:U-box domain-containing protein n=1 Tax=Pelagomonas calceolata TaxID=35677 RepID=A0A7S3ZVM9_9STRA|mmetsp:Transcript_1423/g.3961  ORF Transcript_1423/g.3961 Transcript_1423/m.3961 type:complete len:270 (-) Transcript_1423:25-834(-)
MPPKRKARKPADAIDLTEMASSQEKKQRVALTTIAKEFICPITQELPISPVTAEDGKVYEETAIREWFSKKDGAPTSPSTGAVIGTKLFPAPQARNTIEALIQSGAIAGEIAEAWKQKLEDEKEVKETRAEAEGGDGEAMYMLGAWYREGVNGLAKDDVQARAWYERSAAARHPKGMAAFGELLLLGIGGPEDNVFGVMNVTAAAELGSDVGAYFLGYAFFRGAYGLPKDSIRARFWLTKVVNGECEVKHLNEAGRAEAAAWLRALQDE